MHAQMCGGVVALWAEGSRVIVSRSLVVALRASQRYEDASGWLAGTITAIAADYLIDFLEVCEVPAQSKSSVWPGLGFNS